MSEATDLSRDALHAALDQRGACRHARDQAKAALARADDVVTSIEADIQERATAGNTATAERAREMTEAITEIGT